MKLVFFHNASFFLYKQKHIFEKFKTLGHDIYLLCPNTDEFFNVMKNDGYQVIEIDFKTKNLNPFNNIFLIMRLRKIFKQLDPDFVFTFSIKPNLYSAIAAKFSNKIKVVPNITGLGYVFMKDSFLTKIVVALYRYAFKKIKIVFLQNKDDMELLINVGAINPKLTKPIVLPGDGVDLNLYTYVGLVEGKCKLNFLFSSRLLWDKGIRELIDAFKIVKQKYDNISLTIIGAFYHENPTAVPESYINEQIKFANITYLGHVDNVAKVIAESDCMILPSYREGMPRSLLEASSMGRPIITVDSVGCRDVVEDGVTGYMARVKDVDSLADAMIKFIELPFEQKVAMGRAARMKMEREFDQKVVVKHYVDLIAKSTGVQ